MRNVSDKTAEETKTQIFYIKTFFLEKRAFSEKIKINVLEPDRVQTTIWRMRVAY
jgi:hypothetical protein